MKLKPEQLNNHLKSQLQQVYLVSGDEHLLVQEACDDIRSVAKAQNFIERELFHVETGFDWNQVFDANNAMSLFSERKILELRLSVKLNDAGRKAIVEITANPNPDNLILIVSPKFESSATKAKWFKSLEAQCVHIQIWPMDSQRLPNWIRNRIQQKQLTINNQALTMLTERVDGNLLAAQQEIEKLSLLVEGSEITEELVVQSVSDSSRYDVFDLTDACLKGDSKRSLRVLSGVKGEGLEPPIVLWALSRELRTLSIIQNQLAQGQPSQQVFRKQGVWDKRQGSVQSALNRIPAHQLYELIQFAGKIDMAIKGQRQSDIWDDLAALVFSVCRGTDQIPLPD